MFSYSTKVEYVQPESGRLDITTSLGKTTIEATPDSDTAKEHRESLYLALQELVEWARPIAGDTDDPEQRDQEDEMIERMDGLLEYMKDFIK